MLLGFVVEFIIFCLFPFLLEHLCLNSIQVHLLVYNGTDSNSESFDASFSRSLMSMYDVSFYMSLKADICFLGRHHRHPVQTVYVTSLDICRAMMSTQWY